MIQLLQQQKITGEDKTSEYSNFGSALAGTTAAEVYNGSYEDVMNDYIQRDLGLKNTYVGGVGDLNNYWKWHSQDEMMGAGAILSNISDMLSYGQMQMNESPSYLATAHEPLETFSGDYKCGIFWMIDDANQIIWHNGEIAMENDSGEEVGYQSFLGFSKVKNKVVVVLSNVIGYDEDENSYADLLGYMILDQ